MIGIKLGVVYFSVYFCLCRNTFAFRFSL